MKNRRLVAAVVVVCAVLALFGLFRLLCGILADYWWFRSVGFPSVYTRILLTKVLLWAVGFCLGFGVTAVGFVVARRIAGPTPVIAYARGPWILPLLGMRKILLLACWTVAVLVGLVTGGATAAIWYRALLFLNRVPFGAVDPVFHNDVGFYVFVYPLAVYVRNLLQVLVWVSLAAAALYYLATGMLTVSMPALLPRRVFSHLSKMAGVAFLLLAGGYFLDRYGLLYSTRGFAFGAGYTDIHARLPACWIMVAVSLAVAVTFFLVRSVARLKLMGVAVGVWFGCLVVFQGLVPPFLQWSRARPNELQLEEPYITNTIEQTRKAYKLDGVKEVPYPVAEGLTYEAVLANPATVDNVRLWDWRPLRQTYKQIQEIRQYYDFSDVDVDRYDLERGYTQTLISLRELDHAKLEGRSWVNLRLQYTHGYGLCLSPTNECTENGLPVLLVKDIPPETPPGLDLDRPEIYYGEKTEDYVFVSTDEEEFDYPMGDKNRFVRYAGKGGVEVASAWRKLVFAYYFQDMMILLNEDLVPGSRVMYHRLIPERVHRVAPYLMLDGDAYPVIYGGRIYWIQDAYTTSRFYPYSEPSRLGGLNYIRNSVKAVVDAYDGSMTFYVADEDDPLIQANQRAFPGVYVPMSEMPEGLRAHIRYPEGLFNIQTDKFATFHMRDPQVFYNKEDVWDVPSESYGDQPVRMESYYIIMRLPESERAEFIVMLPFTPRRKPNMIAWLVGRCDGQHYGQLLAYRFPKGKVIYGPSQVEGYIDQDSEISQQLTLWGQRGSNVIRGNLLVIPIAGGILYVEPLYIQAETEAVPQLKRVITAFGERVAMAPTLAASLEKLLVGRAPVAAEPAAAEIIPVPAPLDRDIELLLQEALGHYENAQQALRKPDWPEYGEQMMQMRAKLEQLRTKLSPPQPKDNVAPRD